MPNNAQYAAFEREVNSIVDRTVDRLTRLISEYRGDGAFNINHPSVKPQAERILQDFYSDLNRYIEIRSNQRWRNAIEVLKNKTREAASKSGMTESQFTEAFAYEPKHFSEFIARRYGGKKLSNRVWSIAKELAAEFEYTVDTAISNGVPAKELARDIKKYLREPNRLYRRVRGPDGKLRLSAAAKAYNPGQGIYRSSYKNAFRLARTETNIAFHTATHRKAQELDFIVGIRINLSNNHPECDVCDILVGDYPKDFLFTGWHPQCRCNQTMILKTDSEFAKGADDQTKSINQVDDIPDAFKWYVTSYKSAVRKTFYGQDNEKYVKPLYDLAPKNYPNPCKDKK